MRLILESISAFIMVFIINFGITLGEAQVPFFDVIYNTNILIAIWIASWSFLSLLIFRKTGLTINMINLIMSFRSDDMNKNEFIGSFLFQFIGGLIAALLVWFIIDFGLEENLHLVEDVNSMGGTTPYIKGLFFAREYGVDSWSNEWWDGVGAIAWKPVSINSNWKFGFAAIQGLVCGVSIIISMYINNFIDDKFNTKWTLVGRYFVMIILISITTILSANTTNWVRLLSPAIISQIDSWVNGEMQQTILYTTIIFILFQSIGLLFIYRSKDFKHFANVEDLSKKEVK